MNSVTDIRPLRRMGSPIQKSSGQCLFSGSPKLIAANHVFHRHPAPRHPPSALSSLAINLPNPQFGLHPEGASRCLLPVFSFQRTKLAFALSSKPRAESPESLNFPLWTFNISGGGERDRTDDLLRAKQVLSQLSYTPTETATLRSRHSDLSKFQTPKSAFRVVGLVGVEPTTSRLSGVRSNRS
jgi:hypothetical protein